MEKEKRKKILNIVGWAVFIPVVAFLLFFIIVQVGFSDKAVDIMGFKIYLVADTESMEPELRENDLILVKKFDFDDLKEGDYITFLMPKGGKLVANTHEIVDVKTDEATGARSYETKGINKNILTADRRLVTKNGAGNTNKYLGKYAGKSRPIGLLFAFLRSGFGIAVIVVNVVAITLISMLLKSDKDKKKEAPEGPSSAEGTPSSEGAAANGTPGTDSGGKAAAAESEAERKLREAEEKLRAAEEMLRAAEEKLKAEGAPSAGDAAIGVRTGLKKQKPDKD